MQPPTIGKRAAGKQERRDRLYDAALNLFRQQGYEQTTVDQIVRAAGVAKGTFFNYFPTKDAILRYMGAREVGRLSVSSLAGGDASAIGNLKRLLAALAASLETDRELVRLIFGRGIAVPELLCGDAGGFSIRPTAALLLRRGQNTREVAAWLDPNALAAALDALYLQQLVCWAQAEQPYPLAERLTGIVDLLMMGIAERVAPAKPVV